jgi:Phosphoribosylamine-glycine ligase
MPTAKDHKRIYEAERGPNTGGMGTYSPNPIALAYHDEMIKEVAQEYHKGLQKEGLSYRGIIFFGFMITPEGIKVLEFNTRFGDPETQSILVRLETDLLEIFDMATQDKLNELDIKWSDDQAVTLVLASKGYPGAYEKGKPITIKDKAKLDSLGVVFHAGTKLDGDTAVTNGGRVLSLTAKAPTLDEAMEKAYKMAELIDFEGKTYRKDIGPMVKRIYVQKKAEFDIEGASLAAQIKESLGIHLDSVSPYQRYDMQNITIDEINEISKTILSEPPVDDIYIQEEAFEVEKSMTSPIVVELHRGQYDQREDGLLQSLAVVLEKEDVKIRCARVYDIKGKVTAKELEKIKAYLINPVDQQEGSMKLPNLLEDEQPIIQTKAVIDGFIAMDESALSDFHAKMA